ncbi:MAG TPA: adenosine deaminase [Bacteroidales bacterium]|nr:MAG: adenosine deaminase [Bacteroidetes bacterium GWE2_42_24]OFY32063.1 MAG: adenosine deaminase [Bacteroidetes bacterium GWF2_43_11]PKP25831.1 MAG: adenosine deaminase [Bacteroidetes bacterium HGW-Bacteroidetes-22]HBZ66331.1 adenosine deaminase [Bacteroidales bacterium]
MKKAVPELTYDLVKKLPKAELHCHLDGSLRVGTIIDIAAKEGIELPSTDPEKLNSILAVGSDCQDLETYLKTFDITCSVMQSAEALQRVTYELAEDCVAENVRYLEIRFAPVLHTDRGMKLVEVISAVLKGKELAERKMNIKIGIIICSLRHNNPEESIIAAELAVAFKNKGVVGFDLAGAEKDFPARDHKEAFSMIIKNNINTTVHAGEGYGPESIHQALHHISANRIGHGTRLLENGDLLNYVNDHRIPLEMCITSNVQTKAVDSLAHHPIRFYFDYGLRVTINTDNRLVSNTTLTDEYMIAIKEFGFNAEELKYLILNGFKSAFCGYATKVELINQAMNELEELGLLIRRDYI